MSLPLFDLARQWPAMRDEAMSVVEDIASRGAFSLGPELQAFESDFAAWCGASECVGLANGTVAIELALRAVGAGPGTEVVTVPHTFIATIEAIAATGATPRLVDIDPATYTMDPAAVAGAVTADTAALVPVHLYGRPADMAAIAAAAPGVPIVEDCAQAHGATLGEARVGTLGTLGAFSFYPTKNLGALGDGGAVVTDDPGLAARVRSLRHHGAAPDDANVHLEAGGTERLDNLQAALLRIKLRALDTDNHRRRQAAAWYREALDGLPVDLPPADPDGGMQVHHLFVVGVEERDRVRALLSEAGVGTGVHYPTPAHLQPAWRHLADGEGSFPHAERAAARVLSLPCFPGITREEVLRVAAALGACLG